MTRLRDTAAEIARFLPDQRPSIKGVLLYGSVARGTETPWSDLDLLVVGSDAELRPARLLKLVKNHFPGIRLSIAYVTLQNISSYLGSGSRFLVHIRTEGQILYDPAGILMRALNGPFAPIAAEEEVQRELDRLAMYNDLTRYANSYLFCLAHIYIIAKTIVMARLADAGEYEFDRDRAFEVFSDRWPAARDDVEAIRQLRPFYSLVNHRRPESLPYSFDGNTEKVEAAVAAVRRLAEASTSKIA